MTNPDYIPAALHTDADRRATRTTALTDCTEFLGTPEQIASLFGALATAKGAFKPIPRTKTVRVQMKSGGSYTFDYAPLESILPAIEPALSAEGLCVLQPPGRDANGDMTLTTIIGHSAGGMLVNRFALPPVTGMKDLGAELTYAQRYCLTKVLGLAAGDPDADDVADPDRGESGAQAQPRQQKPKVKEDAPARAPENQAPPEDEGEIQEKVRLETEIRNRIIKVGFRGPALADFIEWSLGESITVADVKASLDLTRRMHKHIMDDDAIERFARDQALANASNGGDHDQA